jgi:DNA-directed RNA polymerase specialized sigma24 family protein
VADDVPPAIGNSSNRHDSLRQCFVVWLSYSILLNVDDFPPRNSRKGGILDGETKLLREADWSVIRRDLLVRATWRARCYRWNRGGNLDLAEGYTVEDVVQEVIMKALSGIRRWDPEKGQLLPWLQAQSRSVMDALAKSASHRREMRIPETESLASTQSLDPLEIVLEEEAEAQTRQRVDALFQAVGGAPELKEVMQVIMDGCQPWPRYIALELDISVREVDNRLKRLRRYALKLAKRDVLRSQ